MWVRMVLGTFCSVYDGDCVLKGVSADEFCSHNQIATVFCCLTDRLIVLVQDGFFFSPLTRNHWTLLGQCVWKDGESVYCQLGRITMALPSGCWSD